MVNPPAPIVIVSGPSGVGKSTVSRLVAAHFDKSAHLEADTFMAMIASGRIEPNLAGAAHQNEVVGGALIVAAMELAAGGYTTVVDGHLFPPAIQQITRAGGRRGVAVHYAVLRADLATCWARAHQRPAGRWALERESFVNLHARFGHLDLPDRHAFDATSDAEDVAATVLAAVNAGTLAFDPDMSGRSVRVDDRSDS